MERITRLAKSKIDVIIFSPPYAGQLQTESKPERDLIKLQMKLKAGLLSGRESIRVAKAGAFNPHTILNIDQRYSPDPENIGNLRYVEL